MIYFYVIQFGKRVAVFRPVFSFVEIIYLDLIFFENNSHGLDFSNKTLLLK